MTLDSNQEVEASTSLPAGTLVSLRIEQDLSSKTARRGDQFPISLLNDVWIGDSVALPAGTKGVGEVIHASGKGFGGRAGELIITARYLEHGGNRIPLRGFKLGVAGADNSATAIIATTAAPIVGIFVTGSSAMIGTGTLAQAKLAQEYRPASDAPTDQTRLEVNEDRGQK